MYINDCERYLTHHSLWHHLIFFWCLSVCQVESFESSLPQTHVQQIKVIASLECRGYSRTMLNNVEGNTNVWSQWKRRRDTLGGALHRDAVVRKDKDIYESICFTTLCKPNSPHSPRVSQSRIEHASAFMCQRRILQAWQHVYGIQWYTAYLLNLIEMSSACVCCVLHRLAKKCQITGCSDSFSVHPHLETWPQSLVLQNYRGCDPTGQCALDVPVGLVDKSPWGKPS